MLVVSDTSPVRALAHLELLDLLARLYGSVVVPPAVVDELTTPPAAFKPLNIGALPFIRVVAPLDRSLVERLRAEIDAGEAQAIALGLELHATALLMDDAAGRAVAQRMALRTIGTLGILGEAKSGGLVAAVRPLLERLTREINFFLSPRLVAAYLQRFGE